MANAIQQFKSGQTYHGRSVCDHNAIFKAEIIKRTAKTVWAKIDEKVERRKVEVRDGQEMIFPFGKYSMAPVIKA